jgi:hypothetical protein
MEDTQDKAAENTGENSEDRCPENLRRHRWKKGGPSPNPGGRPKKAPVTAAYTELIREPLPDDIRAKLKLPRGATWAHALALGQLRSAVKGNTPAAKEIADRIEGRTPQAMELETPKGVEVRWTVSEVGKEYGNEERPPRPCPPHIKSQP